ncbi:MAG: DUF1080 domain-containing protein [Planctomycetaceae bacterium]
MKQLPVLALLTLLFVSLSAIAAAETPRKVDTSKAVPSDAVVIFNGKNTDMLVGPNGEPCRWEVKDSVLVCRTIKGKRQRGLWTKLHFRDAQIHVEFRVPKTNRKGEAAGNSGLYFHGLFEQQILNSYGNPSKPITMNGALYKIRPPLVNASRKTGEWQTYDIIYHAPRRDSAGKPTKPGSFTTLLNGVLVQDHVEVTKRVSTYAPLYYRATPYAKKILASLNRTESGPLQLQDHGNPVEFRNIWIRPLDNKSHVFDDKQK